MSKCSKAAVFQMDPIRVTNTSFTQPMMALEEARNVRHSIG